MGHIPPTPCVSLCVLDAKSPGGRVPGLCVITGLYWSWPTQDKRGEWDGIGQDDARSPWPQFTTHPVFGYIPLPQPLFSWPHPTYAHLLLEALPDEAASPCPIHVPPITP